MKKVIILIYISLMSTNLYAQNLTVATLKLPEFMEAIATRMKTRGTVVDKVVLKDNNRWGIVVSGQWMDLMETGKGLMPIREGENMADVNGKYFTIYSDGSWQEGQLKDNSISALNQEIETIATLPSGVLSTRAQVTQIDNLNFVAIKKNKLWGMWLRSTTTNTPQWYDGNSIATSGNFPKLVEGKNELPYTLYGDGTWKSGVQLESSKDKFAKLSGVYEGIGTVVINGFNKKRFVRVKAYFPGLFTQTRGRKPHLFFKVELFTSQKPKKLSKSFYVKSDYQGYGKDYELVEEGELLTLKAIKYRTDFFNYKITTEGDLEFEGDFTQVADINSIRDHVAKYYQVLLGRYEVKDGYLRLLKYSGNLGRLTIKVDEIKESLINNEIDVMFDHKLDLQASNDQLIQREGRIKSEIFGHLTNINVNGISLLKALPHVKTFNFISTNNPEVKYVMHLPKYGEPTISNIKRSENFSRLLAATTNAQAKAIAEAKRSEEELRINSLKKITSEFTEIREAEKALPAAEHVNFQLSGVKNYLLFENIYYGLFGQIGSMGKDYRDLKRAYGQYMIYYSRASVDLLKEPTPLSWVVNTTETSGGRSKVTESNQYDLIVEKEYVGLLDAFKSDLLTTNGVRVLFDLYVQTTGAVTMEDDIMKISGLFPRYSKPAIRFRENLQRLFTGWFLSNKLSPLTTDQSLDLSLNQVSESIVLIEEELLEALPDKKIANAWIGQNQISKEFYISKYLKSFYERDAISEIEGAKVIKCEYYSAKYDIHYYFYFWKDRKPSLKSSDYFNAKRVDQIIGGPVSSAPKTLKEALKAYYK